MGRIADSHNNSFVFDEETPPPLRSAFSILNIEKDDLTEHNLDELLAEALERIAEDPDLAMAYGRPIAASDLKTAAARLRNPRDRVISELLDYRHHRLDFSNLDELNEAVLGVCKYLSQDPEIEMVDLSLVGHLLSDLLGDLPLDNLDLKVAKLPPIPGTEELLSGLV